MFLLREIIEKLFKDLFYAMLICKLLNVASKWVSTWKRFSWKDLVKKLPK
jgi:hypothetical protein